jgi:predicted GNAT family N-acyltransferase
MKNKETEIRVLVGSDFLETLEKRLGLTNHTDVIKAALTLLNWASEETYSGRMVVSTNIKGKTVHRLVMQNLLNIGKK